MKKVELTPEKKVVVYYVDCSELVKVSDDAYQTIINYQKLEEFKEKVSLKEKLDDVVELYIPTKVKEGVETLYL